MDRLMERERCLLMVDGIKLAQPATLAGFGCGAIIIMLIIGGGAFELIALMVLGIVGTIILRSPLVGLSMLIIMIVSNLSPNLIAGFGAPSVAKLAVPCLMTLLILRYVLWGDLPYVGWLSMWLLAGYVAFNLFGVTYAADWRVTLGNSADFTKVVIVSLIVLAFMQYRYGFETVVISSVVTTTMICFLGFIQVLGVELPSGIQLFSSFNEYHGRFEGPIGDANFFAVILVFNIPLALAQFLRSDKLYKVFCWGAAAALLLFGLLLTQSRGGILALCVALGILFFQLSRRQKLAAIVGFGIFLTSVSTFLGAEAFERLFTLVRLAETAQIDQSAEGRLASFQVAWKIFITHPWGGVGSGNFNIHYQDVALQSGLIFRGEGRSAHSLYLEVLAETGLVGLFLFLSILIVAALGIIGAYRFARAQGEDRLAMQIAAFGAGLSGYMAGMALLHDAFPRFLWIMIVLSVEAERIMRLRLASDKKAQRHLGKLRLTHELRTGLGRRSTG